MSQNSSRRSSASRPSQSSPSSRKAEGRFRPQAASRNEGNSGNGAKGAGKQDRSQGVKPSRGRVQGVNPHSAKRQGGKPPTAKDLYPNAQFANREGVLENFPALMVVNRSLKSYPFRKQFPWCLRLVVAYRADEQSGLPLAKEERTLEAFEQNLFGLLKKSVNGHYVGHTSWRGTREFVFYVDEGSEAEEPLNLFAENQKRELEFALDSDPRWEHAAHYFDYTD